MGSVEDEISMGSRGLNFEVRKRYNTLKIIKEVSLGLVFGIFFLFATLNFSKQRQLCQTNCELNFCSPYILMVLMSSVVCLGLLYYRVVKKYFGEFFSRKVFQPTEKFVKEKLSKSVAAKILIFLAVLVLLGTLIFYETRDDFNRLRSLTGVVSFVLIGYVFSYDKFAIKWRPVLCGFLLQLLLGIFCIRLDFGRTVFKCFSEKISDFLHFSKEGASFVFGHFLVYEEYTFAFASLSTIFYFSLCISVLYYLGAMQFVLLNLGWIIQSLLGTTVCESITAAGNIFLGQSESPLIIAPYIRYLTHSELHAVMVSGFATVSGTVLVAYISFGAEAYHLVTSSVMAAPASLFYAKLFYPETERSLTSSKNIRWQKSADTSLLDAASNGAKTGIELFLNIIANLIAFVGALGFCDSMLKWIFYLIGYNDVGIEFILGKNFIPISWALGVEWADCEAVGHVIGTKTFINEFVAYRELGENMRTGQISERSSAIATYAICGFANPSSMGIMIGALSALAPERRHSITKVAFRAFVAGCIVSLITASIAGLLMTDSMIHELNEAKSLRNKTMLWD